MQPAPPSVYRGLVEHAYKQWNPEKLASMDKLMAKFAGREPELLDQVVRKYVFTARPVAECRPLVAEMLARFEPDRLLEMDRLMVEHAGKESVLYRDLCDRHLRSLGPRDAPLTLGKGEISPGAVADPAIVEAIYQSLVQQAYQRHRPEKLGDVEMLMQKYAGYEGDLLDQIMRKYFFADQRDHAEHVALFAEFFSRFAPAQLPSLATFLRKNKGSEWKAYRSLCQKYLPCRGATWKMPVASRKKPKVAAGDVAGSDEAEVARKVTWNVVDEELERRRSGICLDVTLVAGDLGLSLEGVSVVEVAPGLQAELLGIKKGHQLFALGGQEVPEGVTNAEVDDWVLVWLQGARPLRAQFIDARAEADQGVSPALPRRLLSSASPRAGNVASGEESCCSQTSTAVSESWQDPTAFMIADDQDEPCEEPDTDFEDVWDMDWASIKEDLPPVVPPEKEFADILADARRREQEQRDGGGDAVDIDTVPRQPLLAQADEVYEPAPEEIEASPSIAEPEEEEDTGSGRRELDSCGDMDAAEQQLEAKVADPALVKGGDSTEEAVVANVADEGLAAVATAPVAAGAEDKLPDAQPPHEAGEGKEAESKAEAQEGEVNVVDG